MDLLEIWDTAGGWAGLECGFGAGPLEESVVSPLGKIPSANQTLLCSRDREPTKGPKYTNGLFPPLTNIYLKKT